MSFKRVQSRGRADFCQESIPAKAQRDREQVGAEGPEVRRLKVFRARQRKWGDFAGDVRVAERSNRTVVGLVPVGRSSGGRSTSKVQPRGATPEVLQPGAALYDQSQSRFGRAEVLMGDLLGHWGGDVSTATCTCFKRYASCSFGSYISDYKRPNGPKAK